jgi:hypothetical protein
MLCNIFPVDKMNRIIIRPHAIYVAQWSVLWVSGLKET